MASGIADGLARTHQARIIHRDLDGEKTHQSDAYTIGTSWSFGAGRQTYNEKRNAQLAAIRPSGG